MTTLMSDLRLPLHFLLLHLLCCVSASSIFLAKNPVDGLVACLPHQIQAFTEFKNEFDTRSCNHSDSFNGVWCDNSTGAVMMLRLRACLRGTLKSNSSLFKLHHLRYLNLSDNDFTSSSLPSGFGNLNRLEVLSLSFSGFIGQVPSSFSNLSQLSVLDLSRNRLTGSFPFVRNLTKLSFLRLSRNLITGKLPAWLWKLPFLTSVRLFDNFLNGFESSAEVLVNSSVQLLDLGLNSFEGALPNLPLSIITFSARLNSFSGHIPLSTCNRNSLMNFDLSYNNFTGPIPQCLSNLMSVNLRKNNFEGSLPDMFYAGFTARLLDFGYNQLTGKLPKSLVNCSSLEILCVDHNRIEDTFPFWLKALPNLQVLILRSNKFYGSISPPHQGPLAFPELRIFEISDNNFTGSLSPSYFVNWKASSDQMNEDGSIYMRYTDKVSYSRKDFIDLQYKGLSVEQSQVLTFYAAIDFSGNKIEGQIPESIGHLKGLIALNLSNNAFTGHIPLSLANLTNLQSLDISRNQLSGTIPNGLKTLSFLAYVNVSHNQLKGEIPQGTQITGQPKSSFEGNAGLCGLPLEESCFGTTTPPKQQPKQEDEEEEDNEVLSWKGVAIGYGLGVLFGLAIAQVIAYYKYEWLLTKIICLK